MIVPHNETDFKVIANDLANLLQLTVIDDDETFVLENNKYILFLYPELQSFHAHSLMQKSSFGYKFQSVQHVKEKLVEKGFITQ